jgi:hypothetical protein
MKPAVGLVWIPIVAPSNRYLVLGMRPVDTDLISFDVVLIASFFTSSLFKSVYNHCVSPALVEGPEASVRFEEPTEIEQQIFAVAQLNPDGLSDFVKGLNNEQRA